MITSRSTIIYFLIVLGHYLISYFVPQDNRIFVYFGSAIGACIFTLLTNNFLKNEEVAKWSVLITILLVSYVICGSVIWAFIDDLTYSTTISSTIVTICINAIIYAAVSTWRKFTKGLPANTVISMFMLVVTFPLAILSLIDKFFGPGAISQNIGGTIAMFCIVIGFQIGSVLAIEKWDTANQQQ